ncbi:hypothetical protein Tco_1302098 [Tanacetum coccineum]
MLCGLDQLMERKEDRVKAEHKAFGFYCTSEIHLMWKWDNITMDFITKLPSMEKLARLYIDEIVARHGVHVSIISNRDGRDKLVNGGLVLIKERLKEARDRQKSYADNRRKPLEFEVGDQVLLKVSPWKGVVRFGTKTGMFAQFIRRTFEIIERIES